MESIAKKVLDKLSECFSQKFDIGETIIECCEMIKNDLKAVNKDRAEFFCTLWQESEKYDFSEQELDHLAAIEATIVMMCGGKLSADKEDHCDSCRDTCSCCGEEVSPGDEEGRYVLCADCRKEFYNAMDNDWVIVCARCNTPVLRSSVPGYSYYCPEHNEDLYSFEVFKIPGVNNATMY